MVQGIFDDLNPETVERWAYPDTGQWDPDRNTIDWIAERGDTNVLIEIANECRQVFWWMTCEDVSDPSESFRLPSRY